MKKFYYGLVVILTLSIIAILPTKGYADGWQLYDDFNYTGVPDTDFWELGYSSPSCEADPSATIYVNGSAALFTHNPKKSGCSTWLRIKNPEGLPITAVMASVKLEGSCGPDAKGRIGAVIGQDGSGNVVFQDIAVTYNRRITTSANSFDSGNNLVDHIFSSSFGYWPIMEYFGQNWVIVMGLDRSELNFSAFRPLAGALPQLDLGSTSFTPPEEIYENADSWVGIGSRNDTLPTRRPNDGDEGPCLIYFDNVLVYVVD